MVDPKKRLYWDTSVFLCFLNEAEEERRDICQDILDHAKDGDVEIITSMYSLVEVIRPKGIKFPTQLTPTEVEKLEGMFRWPWLKKIQIHEDLAISASRLARAHGLKPADAIHAATAISEQVTELQKWDSDFSKIAHLISVTEPTYLSQLPLLLQTSRPIGPTPTDFKGDSSTEPLQLSSQSGDDEQP